MTSNQIRRLTVLRSHLKGDVHDSEDLVKRESCQAQYVSLNSDQKFITAEEAAGLVPDNATITFGGFVGTGYPEYLVDAIRARFDRSGHPRLLNLLVVALVGDGKGRGMDALAVESLVGSLKYSWTGLSPKYLELIRLNKVLAWNLPLGVVSHMIRDIAAGRSGPVTRIGLKTFVDPREKGGKMNSVPQPDVVQLVELGGKEFLWYKVPKIDVAILRGTTADLDGNISCEKEALLLDSLNQAMAAHNSGGLVIVQVERVVQRGTLPPRLVHIPGALVDKVVVAPAEKHWQTLAGPEYEGALSGEIRSPSAPSATAMHPGERRFISHRAMLEISKPHSVVNLGVGMPEGVTQMVATHSSQIEHSLPVHLSTEAGILGGFPAGKLRFGAGYNADAHMPTSSMIDFYNGGGVDVACLGMAEVDREGNVNVSNFGPGRQPGCGGFIDISQSAKTVIFMGTLTSGGLKVTAQEGQIRIVAEGRLRKFVGAVREKTFAASTAGGRPILYVTERAVFRLREGEGLELTEVAPGVDIERDVLAHMEFRPILRNVKAMDHRIFSSES